jgi:hypothetical protein
MTGPIARVTCPGCGGLFARRLDGRTPYRHVCCTDPTWRPAPRARCADCGAFVGRDRACPKCGRPTREAMK